MRLSIIIPTYNEEERLPSTLKRLVMFFRGLAISFEVIVVDDGSTDCSCEIALKAADHWPEVALLSCPRNRGKGFAAGQGVLGARGALILFTDADLSTPIEEFSKLEKSLALGYDIVIGSRRIRGADIRIRQPFLRRMAGRIFGWMSEVILLSGIKDTQCGFKLFRSPIAKKAFSLRCVQGFSFDAEILYIAKKRLGARIKEVPVQWNDSAKYSKVCLRKEAFRMFMDLIRIRMIH